MDKKVYDIEKAAAVILDNRRAILTRSKGKDVFVPPGGKLEGDETQVQALIRELKEELGIDVTEDDLEFVDNFYAEAAGGSGKSLKMGVWMVSRYSGDISAQSEVEELARVSSELPEGMEVGSIFKHNVIPHLKQQGLID